MGKKKSNKNKKNTKKKTKASNTNTNDNNNNNTNNNNNVDNVMAGLENASISALDAQPGNRQPSEQPSDLYPFVGSFTSPVFGRAPGRPPIEPGRTARVVGLVNRRDLNGGQVTIKSFLKNYLTLIHLENTDYENRESIAIRPQNLEVNYNVTGREWGQGIEECPICLDTKMDTTKNASIMECW